MSGKLGKRLLYLGLPAVGIAFCLYYLSIATKDVAYTDYMRLIVSYLPDVANPAKFFVPDVLTRVPITYLGRIINVALFHYSTTFDMVLGVISHGLAALALASYCRDKKGYGSWFLVIMLLMFSLNKWEMLTNGSGWSHFFAFACFYYHELVLDRVWAGEEKRRDRLKLLVLPWLIILGTAGPYCAVYAATLLLSYGFCMVMDRRKRKDCQGRKGQGSWDMRYLAYFQAYTNTYDRLDSLILKYEEALAYPGVEGLIVGTRPDCMPEGLLDYFAELSQRKFVMIEYGLESTLDKTLVRINRGHTHEESESAIRRTAAKGIYTGAHLILGLPGESRDETLHHADVLSRLPITTLKLHQLQLIKNTRMAKEFKEDPSDFHLYTADEYIELVIDFIERLNPSIVVERFVSQSPKELLIAPDWGLKNFEFTAKVNKRIEERDTRQGRLFQV